MLRRLGLLIVFALSLPLSLRAQWTKLYTFPSPVETVYFEDKIGSPAVGFVGLSGGDIWKTTDNGISWTKMTMNATGVSDITQFVFRNSNQGWASPRIGPLLTTTDGGLNWNASTLNFGDEWVSIGLCTASGMLVAVDRQALSYKSTDFGQNWTTFGSASMNGVSFSGNQGIISTYLSTSLMYTTDGGSSWQNCSPTLSEEIWSPHLVPGTSLGFAVSESSQRDVWRTVNGGASWTKVYNFPTTGVTGTIMGTASAMFLQSTSSGFYYSSNQGTSWMSICGPSTIVDYRFYTRGTEIFAPEQSSRSLWYNADGSRAGSGTLSLEKTSLSMKGVRCGITDSMIRIQLGGTCVSGSLVKAQILKGAPAFSVSAVFLPKAINGKDSIGINYMPSKGLADTGLLLLEFLNGSVTVDTLITLYGTGTQSVSYYHDANIYLYSPYACSERDSFVVLTNRSCDTLTLTAATLSDTSHFQIQLPQLPSFLAPFASDTIRVIVTSKKDGTFTAMLRLLMQGTTGNIKDSIPLRYDVTQGGRALFGSLSVSLPNRCYSLDTIYPIASTACDSIRLLSAVLADTTVFRMGSVLIPATIPAGGVLSLPIHIVSQTKGNYSTKLRVRYLAGSKFIDTVVTLSLAIADDLPVAMTFSHPQLDFGAVNVPCGSADLNLRIGDTLCTGMQITKIVLDPPNADYTLDPLSLPVTVGSMDSMHFSVHFKPSKTGTSPTMLRVTLRSPDGRTVDTLIPILGRGTTDFKDTLLTPLLRFDTLLQCGEQELVGDLVNLSCNDIRALGTMLGDTADFQVLSPSFPRTIAHGDTLHVRFRLKPQHSGSLGDSVTILVHNDADGKDYPKKIALSAFVQPIVHRDSIDLTSFKHTTIVPCGSTSDSVMIWNLGTCDDIVINSLDQLGYSGIVFNPAPKLPIVLHPGDGTRAGDSIKLYFNILPPIDGTVTSDIDIKGTNINRKLNFTYGTVPGAHQMTFTAKDSVFPTRQCVNVSRRYVIHSTGCSDVTIDSALIAGLAGQDQFTISGLPKMPVTLNPNDSLVFDVVYNPDGAGNNSASLGVYSNNGRFTRQIPLAAAVVNNTAHARLAIIGSDMTRSLRSRPGTPVAIKVLAVDGIGDTCHLQSISFDLHYNWNLLTRGASTFANGWSATDNTEHDGGLLTVTMHHDVTAAVGDSTVLTMIPFTTTLGDSTWTDIQLDNVRFNDGDTNYARCILSAAAISDSVHYVTIDTCGDPTERNLINGITLVSRIGLHPNPGTIASGHGRSSLTMTLGSEATVLVTVRDMLGREYEPRSYRFSAGEQIVDLDLPEAAEGAYFVTVEALAAGASGRATRKLLMRAP